jgi:hypothetical protein
MTKLHVQAEGAQGRNVFVDVGFTPAEAAELTAETLVRHLRLLGKISVSGADARKTLEVFGFPSEQTRATFADVSIDSLSGTDFERR